MEYSARMRVLVVEDEALIAIEIDAILTEAGFSVAGPVACVKDGLDIIEREPIDAGVLDVNLGRETSEAVAIELTRRGIPFVAVSGYAADQRPVAFGGARFVSKPFRARELVAAIRQLR